MEEKPFTIESFYEFCSQGKLMGAKCLKCGKIHAPPRPSCINCGSNKFEWIELSKTGKIISFTIIHVAPPRFADKTPYAVGIIELDDGVRLPGMIKNVEFNELKIGIKVKVEFEEAVEKEEWPKWTRYYFVPY
ncbi:MAG: Zn-ribbon domain-containing OB-fold protein [archaeon GB-1867-035]|nr:Zn-ribbon domain-containing OB-fold protein [Candidatus Culexmicrobium profundum]